MDSEEKSKVVEEGRRRLKANIFPNDLVENEPSKRWREELQREIFSPENNDPGSLSADEKTKRAKLLTAQLEFLNYLHIMERAKRVGAVLLLVGFVILFFSVTRSPSNFIFGAITLTEGILLTLAFRSAKSINRHYLTAFFTLLVAIVLELVAMGLPASVAGPVVRDMTFNMQSAGRMLNEGSPFIYLAAKLTILMMIGMTSLAIRKFEVAKKNFETAN